MTGQVDIQPADMPLDKHHHLLLHFSNQHQLRYRDPRKFGLFYLVADVNDVIGLSAQSRLTTHLALSSSVN